MELNDQERRKYEKIWEHKDYREISPGLSILKTYEVIKVFRKYGVESILDAGCGSGSAMQYIMEKAPDEFDIHGIDIASNCLNPYFDQIKDEILTVGNLWDKNTYERKYDAIICTDVMEHIPPKKVDDVIANLRNFCNKIALFGICLVPDISGPKLINEPLHLSVLSFEDWVKKFMISGQKIMDQRVKLIDGKPVYAIFWINPSKT